MLIGVFPKLSWPTYSWPTLGWPVSVLSGIFYPPGDSEEVFYSNKQYSVIVDGIELFEPLRKFGVR